MIVSTGDATGSLWSSEAIAKKFAINAQDILHLFFLNAKVTNKFLKGPNKELVKLVDIFCPFFKAKLNKIQTPDDYLSFIADGSAGTKYTRTQKKFLHKVVSQFICTHKFSFKAFSCARNLLAMWSHEPTDDIHQENSFIAEDHPIIDKCHTTYSVNGQWNSLIIAQAATVLQHCGS